MPIVKINSDSITQRCATCGAHHVHRIDTLRLGARMAPDTIVLPPCTCGTNECLVRNLEAPPSNDRSHRKAVNALALALKSRGRVAEEHRGVYAGDRVPIDVMDLGAAVDVVSTKEQRR